MNTHHRGSQPECEVLFDLFTDRLGAVQLGRLLNGHDAGRLVTLRRLTSSVSTELESAASRASKIAHPKLAKSLGIIRSADAAFVASEHISGVTLFELGRAVTSSGTPLSVAVAVRIVLDALEAGQEATRLLLEQAGQRAVRCIYPESIWIADFGETFLAEVLVAQRLDRAASLRDGLPSYSDTNPAFADRVAAIRELVRLATGRAPTSVPNASDMARLPVELSAILLKGLSQPGPRGQDTVSAFVQDLAGIGSALIASEEAVSRQLRRVVAPLIEQRQKMLEMLERRSSPARGDDATKFFLAPAPAAGAEASVEAPVADRQTTDDLPDEPTILLPQKPTQPSPLLDLEAPTDEFEMGFGSEASLGGWREPLAVSEPLERQTSPNLRPMLHDSLGRTTSPNLLGAPHHAAPDREPRPSSSPRNSRAPTRTPKRAASAFKTLLLIVVAVAVGAALHSAWLARRAANAPPRSIPASLR